MFENRMSMAFPTMVTPAETLAQLTAPLQNLVPMASIEEVYQAAFTRARNDYKLDRLFNPEHYGDHGSGI